MESTREEMHRNRMARKGKAEMTVRREERVRREKREVRGRRVAREYRGRTR